MIVNFEIEDNHAVQFQNRHIDIHNNFRLTEIHNLQDIIEIEFKKSDGDWVKKNELVKLTFSFNRISYKYEEKGENETYPEDWKVLGELTFFTSDMRDVNDGIIQQRLSKNNDGIIFFFENGRLIRINCDEANLKVE